MARTVIRIVTIAVAVLGFLLLWASIASKSDLIRMNDERSVASRNVSGGA